MAKLEEVTKALMYLAALYPRFVLTEPTIKAYQTILKDLSPELIEKAVEDLGANSTFFPAAAEIRRAAFDLVDQSQGIPSASEAWGQVKGIYADVRQLRLHPLAIEAVNSLGGLSAFGQSSLDAEASWRARFIQAYDVLAKRKRREMDMLPGVRLYADKLAAGKVDSEIQELTAKLTTKQSWPHDWDVSFGHTPEKKMSREELYGDESPDGNE